jgi:lysine decarboxylase
MDIRSAMKACSENVPLEKAEGRVSAQSFGPYPPGIAVVIPGERIEHSHTLFLKSALEKGIPLFGCSGGAISCVKSI